MFVATEKKPVGWRIPPAIREEFDRLANASVSGKQHWALVSAAVLLFCATDESVRESLIDELLAADRREDFGGLIERARAGKIAANGKESPFEIPAGRGKPLRAAAAKDRQKDV
jgi:hypothetical protein